MENIPGFSFPDNAAAVLPPLENMMSDYSLLYIPTALPPVLNVREWTPAGNMSGLGGPPMTVLTGSGISTVENMSGLSGPPMTVLTGSGISTVENMSGLSGHPTTFFTGSGNPEEFLPAENMAGVVSGPPTTSFTGSGIPTEFFPVENLAGLSGPPTTVFTGSGIPTEFLPVEYMTGLSRPPMTTVFTGGSGISTKCSMVVATAEVGPYRMMEIEKEVEDQRSSLYPSSGSKISTTPHMQDSTMLSVKVEYNTEVFKFHLINPPTIHGLKTQVLKRISKLEGDDNGLKFMYKDEEGEMITIACDEDVLFCIQYFKSLEKTTVRLTLVVAAADASSY